jgi:hypothetical protein
VVIQDATLLTCNDRHPCTLYNVVVPSLKPVLSNLGQGICFGQVYGGPSGKVGLEKTNDDSDDARL